MLRGRQEPVARGRGSTVAFLGPFLGRKAPGRFADLRGGALAGGGGCLGGVEGVFFPPSPFKEKTPQT